MCRREFRAISEIPIRQGGVCEMAPRVHLNRAILRLAGRPRILEPWPTVMHGSEDFPSISQDSINALHFIGVLSSTPILSKNMLHGDDSR